MIEVIFIKNKILVVFTGGTIGSVVKDNVVDVSEGTKYMLLDMYGKLPDNKDVEFYSIMPVNMLSENAAIEDWQKIAADVEAIDLANYDGIIVTHGTDTLGYFANALAYMLNRVKLPIMVVSTDRILTNENANGLENFKVAVDFIMNACSKAGVFVSYRNSDGVVYIHRGKRVKQIIELSDNVHSLNNMYFAKVVNGDILVNAEDVKCGDNLYDINFTPKLDGILYIKPIVGQTYDYNIDEYRFVYHEMFHSGTIPMQALELIKECKQKNKLFFMGVSDENIQNFYAPTKEAIDAGAVLLSDMSQEAAIIKLMMANGTFSTNEEILEFMKK
ncbi:MAG: asparaginase [Oscillospiraceae bacterium]|nr:asparaginase [Oscillospiraceae bacterium]